VRAVVLREFGSPDGVIAEDVADPIVAGGQVLVRVEFANITYVETQVRAGTPPHPSMRPPLPVVLGNGVGGVVAAIGTGVDDALLGRRVVTSTGGSGGYAELAVVDADALIGVPEKMPLDTAVALMADGRTAMGLVDLAAVGDGDTVLVEAAAGGVGSLLVQLARNVGASVVGVAGGARKVEIVKGLGATVAVDYSRPDWTRQVVAEQGDVNVVFDGVGGSVGAACYGLLADGGRFVPYGMASGEFTAIPDDDRLRRGIDVLRSPMRSPAELRDLTRRALREASEGRLAPVIGQRFPLDRAADAHAAIAARETIGKTLLIV
jgi:NADPH2:quinone reductase